MQKLYCYLDETGLDTAGKLFIVSAVVIEEPRDPLLASLQSCERSSGKGLVKWAWAKHTARMEYMKTILSLPFFKGSLYYSIYRDTKAYRECTVLTAAKAITSRAVGDYKATVLVDGLPQSQVNWFGSELRKQTIRIRKVRGIKSDETDALIRLADALCGLTRLALEAAEASNLLEKAIQDGYILEK